MAQPDAIAGNAPAPEPPPELAERLWPSREQRLLLEAALLHGERSLCAYREWRAGTNLDAEFSWSVLRLLPAVYEKLRAAGHDDRLMGRLKGVYRRAWYESNQLFHRVRPVVQGLAERGVPVLVLKGAALLLAYYRQHGLRPMADIDLWVSESSLPVALQVLRDQGWRFGIEPDTDHIRFHHAVQCFGPDGGELDLHWHVFWERGRRAVDEAALARSEPIDFLGIPLRQLDPTTLLLHVVTHGVRWNRETPIRWIPDSLTILRQRGADVDWTLFTRLTREMHSARRTSMGLAYLAGRFGAPIPGHVIRTLADTRLTLLERIDNSVLLRSEDAFAHSALRQQWAAFADYCRRTEKKALSSAGACRVVHHHNHGDAFGRRV